jgi:hypothetical protein
MIPSSKARERGCRDGGVFHLNRLDPEFVSVRADDQPVVAEGVVHDSHVSYQDWPFSHDFTFELELDEQYEELCSDANAKEAEPGEVKPVIEVEWETKYFPSRYWPVDGDRVWVLGRWIFDCAHPPCATEIHPPQARVT